MEGFTVTETKHVLTLWNKEMDPEAYDVILKIRPRHVTPKQINKMHDDMLKSHHYKVAERLRISLPNTIVYFSALESQGVIMRRINELNHPKLSECMWTRIIYEACTDACWYVDENDDFKAAVYHSEGADHHLFRMWNPEIPEKELNKIQKSMLSYDVIATNEDIEKFTVPLGSYVRKCYEMSDEERRKHDARLREERKHRMFREYSSLVEYPILKTEAKLVIYGVGARNNSVKFKDLMRIFPEEELSRFLGPEEAAAILNPKEREITRAALAKLAQNKPVDPEEFSIRNNLMGLAFLSEKLALTRILPNTLICLASLKIDDGIRPAFKMIDNHNLSACLDPLLKTEVRHSPQPRWYVDTNDDLKAHVFANGGENNFLFRMWKENPSEEEKKQFCEDFLKGKVTAEDIDRMTVSIGSIVTECHNAGNRYKDIYKTYASAPDFPPEAEWSVSYIWEEMHIGNEGYEDCLRKFLKEDYYRADRPEKLTALTAIRDWEFLITTLTLTRILPDTMVCLAQLQPKSGEMRKGYKLIDSLNLGACFSYEAIGKACYDAEWYLCWNGDLRAEGSHDDGINNYLFRMWKPDLSKNEKKQFCHNFIHGIADDYDIDKFTLPLGSYVMECYNSDNPFLMKN